MADVLHTMAGLQRELGKNADAAAALERSAVLYRALVPTDPNPPSIREGLGMVEADLAYTWQFDTSSHDINRGRVEAQYRRAPSTFEQIEHDWPQRRQPVTLCLRSLADATFQRGDQVGAEQLWRDAISRGEAYVDQHPANVQARTDVCWACAEYYEAILRAAPDRTNEAEALLARGVKHAKIMRSEHPNSTQAADVLAALIFRQALVDCRTGKIDEAIPTLSRGHRRKSVARGDHSLGRRLLEHHAMVSPGITQESSKGRTRRRHGRIHPPDDNVVAQARCKCLTR